MKRLVLTVLVACAAVLGFVAIKDDSVINSPHSVIQSGVDYIASQQP